MFVGKVQSTAILIVPEGGLTFPAGGMRVRFTN